MSYFFAISLGGLAVFLIMLVLVQRGRGGGLAGALGGVGGSSAFGAKAGDVFTKITVVTTFLWILLCVSAAYWAGHRSGLLGNFPAPTGTSTESSGGDDSTTSSEDSATSDAEAGAESSATEETPVANEPGSDG